jgi:hypothetical protein
MLKDALRCLKQLSMYLQSRDATAINAMDQVDIVRDKLLALKDGQGQSLKKCIASYETDGCYKGVPLLKNESDDDTFQRLKRQFFQALHDNVLQRFPCSGILAASRVLSKSS